MKRGLCLRCLLSPNSLISQTGSFLAITPLKWSLRSFALWELGIEVQLLNTRLTAAEISFQLQDAHCDWVITADQAAVSDVRSLTLTSDQTGGGFYRFCCSSFVPNKAIYQAEQVASIMYTSGTTGNPKGVPQTFGNHLASAEATQKLSHH